MPIRILVAGLFHEGNSFSSLLTVRENFALTVGDAVLAKAVNSMSALGGACRLLRSENVEIVPVLTAIAPPGGPIRNDVFNELRSLLLQAIGREKVDGIYLDLHGAMITETSDDPEGELLRDIRTAVGDRVPISISLDLHAHVTQTMLECSDIAIACKENPHTDYHLAGEKAARLLLDTIGGGLRPATAAIWLPMVIGARMDTRHGPLKAVHDAARALCAQNPCLADISVYNTTSLVDAKGAGQCVTALSNDNLERARSAVEELGSLLWSLRGEFTPDFAELDDILADVRAGKVGRPVIVGDQGDRVLAGTPGDGTSVLGKLIRDWPDLRSLVPVTDPRVVGLATEAGIGSTVEAEIGGQFTHGQTRVAGRWVVLQLGDGEFVQRGPYLANEPAKLGRTALLEMDNVVVLATEIPGFTQDPEAFESQGARLDDFDVIVAKSGYHFKLSFARTGTCVVANTPGISNYKMDAIRYSKREICPSGVDGFSSPEPTLWISTVRF